MWRVVTSVKCCSETLGGLSLNDFHIAMLIDVVAAAREKARKLILEDKDSLNELIQRLLRQHIINTILICL